MVRVSTLLLLVVLLVRPAFAAVLTVPGDYPTLLAAADAAVSGDSISLSPGTYTERETRDVNGTMVRASAFVAPGVTILGTAETTFVVSDAPDLSVLNTIIAPTTDAPDSIALQGLTMVGAGSWTSAVVTGTVQRAQIEIRDCVVEGFGAAIWNENPQCVVRVEESQIRNNDARLAAAPAVVYTRGASLSLIACEVVDNVGTLVRRGAGGVSILGCRFLRNEGVAVRARESLLEGNLFYGNTSPEDSSLVYAFNGSVRRCLFVENAGSQVLDGGSESSSCNLFWNNEGDPGDPHNRDVFLDPQFCDPLHGDFRVAASSPCLPENNFGCGLIGSRGEGCPSTGVVTHVVRTDPDADIVVDGVMLSSPALVAWETGSTRTIECPEGQLENGGRRQGFDYWVHGGDRVQEVIAPPAPQSFTAVLKLEVSVTMQVDGSGSVTPETGWYEVDEPLEIQAFPDVGWEFVEWIGEGGVNSYSGPRNPVTLRPRWPTTETAVFRLGTFQLSTDVVGEGRIVPDPGPFPAFEDRLLRARPEKGWRFVEWRGSGEGSYTGRANPTVITMDEDIAQTAYFEPVRFNVEMSLSAFSPNVHEGPPLDFGEVHVWVTCAGGRRVQELDLEVSGTMDVLAFVPAPGMISQGTNPVTVNTGICRWSSARLGHFLVNDPGGGTLCIDIAGNAQPLVVTDCSGSPSPWPGRVSFVGVNTAGGAACSTGTGCSNQIETGPEAGGGTDVALAAPMRIGLNEVFPNPFTGETTIRYALSRPQQVRIAVYDVTGRRVRLLRDAPVEPGVSSMVWDGRDFAGARVASGVYFVRLQADEVTEARKVVRIGGGR